MFREWLTLFTEQAVLWIDAVALLVIVGATIQAVVGMLRVTFTPATVEEKREVWLRYARWLIVGLTFQLAADIVETSITTDWQAIARVAAIAVIRTFLNYFLEKDFYELRKRAERSADTNLEHWAGRSKKSARREIFYYDETDLMAIRVDNWKMHIGVKREGSWWDAKYYPSVPYIFNLRMDPMEKMDPQSHEWGYIGRKFFAAKLWAPTAAGPIIARHLKSLMEFPPSQGADTLSMKKALEEAQRKMELPHGSSN